MAEGQGAAIAYYAAFSIGPLLLLTVSVAGMVFGEEAARGRLLEQLRGLMGPYGAEAIEAMLAGARNPQAGIMASLMGVAMLLFGAAGAFGAIQDALNTVWEVQPRTDRGIWGILQERFLSFTMVFGTAFLLLISLVISATLTAMGSLIGNGEQTGFIGISAQAGISFAVITLLFAMIFKYLPDALVPWNDVWFGAIVTSSLFAIGKFSIGMYLGHSAVGSAFGVAGSLAVLMVWLYYSAQIFLSWRRIDESLREAQRSRDHSRCKRGASDWRKPGPTGNFCNGAATAIVINERGRRNTLPHDRKARPLGEKACTDCSEIGQARTRSAARRPMHNVPEPANATSPGGMAFADLLRMLHLLLRTGERS